MKNKKKLLVVICTIALVMILAVATFIVRYGKNFGIYLIPPSPQEYVDTAIAFMENGIYANGEEWIGAKEKAKEAAKSCSSYEETYPIIQEALTVAGGKHSAINTVEEIHNVVENQTMPEVRFEDGIIYILIPPYSADSKESQKYIDSVLPAIEHYSGQIKGAIIDLRDNVGGDMRPMIGAVTPFLPDGMLMGFSVANNVQEVSLKDGELNVSGSITKVGKIEKIAVPVAILQNEWTASSGEATLLCFKGLDNVKTFGTDSAGYCSANMVKYLYDGANIQLTIGKDVDRNNNEYCDEGIVPDVATDTPYEDAMEWIQSNW